MLFQAKALLTYTEKILLIQKAYIRAGTWLNMGTMQMAL